MKRELVRIRRAHGLLPLVAPLLAVLLTMVAFDQYLDDYLARREDVQSLALKLDTVQAALGLKKHVEKTHEKLLPEYSALQQRAYTAETPDASRSALEAQVRSLLQSLYFDGIEFLPMPATPVRDAAIVSVQVRFNGVPQQLPRLEAALAGSARTVRTRVLAMEVADDLPRGTQQLLLTATFTGLHLKPEPPQPAASKPGAPRSGAGQRTGASATPPASAAARSGAPLSKI